ncbi:MAG: DUF5977 domain-containing protein [Ferruginibacter sp.]
MKKIFLFLLLVKLQPVVWAQVSLQTGSATFSMPFFNWHDNKSRLNSVVAISYNSGNGLKVNDLASNVGQGWSLVAGGVINRIQAGEPDDQVAYNGNGDHTDQDITKYPCGILYATVPAFKGCPSALTTYPIYGWKNQVYTQRSLIAEDKQLDYFSFQFNGKAGMFVLDPTKMGIAQSLGDTKMKITYQQDASMVNQGIRTKITSFTIQDIDGLLYKFTLHGLSKVLQFNYCDGNLNQSWSQPNFKSDKVYHQAGFDNGQFVNPWVIGSWSLSEIEDPLTHRKIILSYATRFVNSKAGEDISYNSSKDYTIISHKTSITQTPEISAITYPDGHTVNFGYGNARLDLAGEFALSSADVIYQGRFVSKYLLKTSYFILNRYGTPVSEYQKSVARLCLMSVQKIGVDLKEDTPPYLFDYYLGSNAPDDFVPPPFFYAKDIWGFYNGSNSKGFSNEVIPLNTNVSQLSNKQTKGLCFLNAGVSGVYLNTKSGYARNGLLRQIIYPTAGTLTYQYIQNDGVLNGTTGAIGGVHVSQTSTTDGGYSNGCSNPINTQYNYVLNGTGSASSLWGLEMPVNSTNSDNHYQPEWKSYHLTVSSAPFGECYWHYRYPGILSQQQQINLAGWQQVLSSIAPVLGIVSIVSTIMDIATVFSGGSPVALIIDIIGGLINIGLTCIGSQSRDSNVTIYYNSDLNGVSPLPTQFKRVEIVESTGAIGKTVQDFTSSVDYPIWAPTNPLFTAKQRFAPWAYGLPKLTTVYNAAGTIVKQTVNTYDFSNSQNIIDGCIYHPSANVCNPANTTGINSFLISCKCLVKKITSQRNTDWSDPTKYSNAYQMSSTPEMGVEFYAMYTGRTELSSTEERSFKTSNPSQYLSTTTSYSYNSNFNYEVYRISTTQSNNVSKVTHISYSADFGTSQNAALVALAQNNILNIPVSTYIADFNYGGSQMERFLGEKVTEFTQLATGDIQPVRILEQRLAQPSTTAIQYNPDNVNNPTIYKTIKTFTYDAAANLVGMKDEGSRSVTNIYDYQDKYPVATITNADAILDKASYTSFESATFGGWSLTGSGPVYVNSGITGARSFTLNGNTFTRSSLNTGKAYILSFWATNAGVIVNGGATLVKTLPGINGFTYYEYNINLGTATVSVSGSANIDELRLYPSSARMGTVTYDPIIGKTSECDENNRITYYEYDNLGRLQFIKDQSGNVVKMYEYNDVSAAKQNGCPAIYYNHLVSEVFTKANCAAGYIGGNVTFTIAANTYSSIISQAEADAQAENNVLTNGQTYANTNGTCILLYYNTAQSQVFATESCPDGYLGGSVTYSVPANRYSSIISQADANQKALDEIAANGDAWANSPAHRTCTLDNTPNWSWKEGAPSYCLSVNGALPPHLFIFQTNINPNSSTYNQTRWFDAGPQNDCPANTYYNAAQSQVFYKNNCSSGGGSAVTYTVPAGKYGSTVSQAAANQLATNEITANGQNNANTNGNCCLPAFAFASGISPIYNTTTLSGTTVTFTWVANYPGSSTYFTLGNITTSCCFPSGTRTIPFVSGSSIFNIIISSTGLVQVQLVSGPVPTNGVGFHGSYDLYATTYYSSATSGTFTRNNCPAGQTGGYTTYNVAAYAYTSTISQADANLKAQNDLNANGQNYANANGNCSVSCSFAPATGISFYTSTISSSGTTGSFNLVFPSPNTYYTGGTIGTISVGCRPSATRYLTVTDGATSSRTWSVTIYNTGVVQISLAGGSAVTTSTPPIVVAGTYAL